MKPGDNVKFIWGMGLWQYKGKIKRIIREEAIVEVTHIYRWIRKENKFMWEKRDNIFKIPGREKCDPMYLSVPLGSLKLKGESNDV